MKSYIGYLWIDGNLMRRSTSLCVGVLALVAVFIITQLLPSPNNNSTTEAMRVRRLRSELAKLQVEMNNIATVTPAPGVSNMPPQASPLGPDPSSEDATRELAELHSTIRRDKEFIEGLKPELEKLRAESQQIKPPAPASPAAAAAAAPPPARPPAPASAGRNGILDSRFMSQSFHKTCDMMRKHEMKFWGPNHAKRLGLVRAPVTLLVGVMSFWDHKEQRATIRKTWMRLAHDLPKKWPQVRVRFEFILAMANWSSEDWSRSNYSTYVHIW